MKLLEEFIKYIHEQNLFQKKDRLLLAVSGGLDSVVLCELCHQAGFDFEIAHCNFQLRGEESERDEKFVRALSDKYDVKIFVKKFDTKEYAQRNKLSTQVAARELRYAWFDGLLDASNRQPVTGNQETSYIQHRTSHISSCTYLLTAHHANDNIETLLMNFFKGTGITGLHGILPKHGKITRPLLFAKREEIIVFAKENNVSFVEDSSNISDKYTRNYFRNQLIPAVKEVFPQAEQNLLHNIERFKEIEILYHQSIQFHKKKLLEQKGNEIHIPVLKLLKAEPLKTIVYEIIKNFGFTAHQTDEVVALLKSESGKYISSATHKAIKNRNWLIIAPVNTLEANHILINEKDKEINFEEGKLKLKRLQNSNLHLSNSNNIATLDANNITFPLLLRKWKQGDYFYPFGMQKKKKLSKFFIDQKMSLTDKEKVWVIESNKKIIWVIGKRIDDRFKITSKTKDVLEISLN
jgi:tRNA(Ile)-lysidine synthase